MRAQSTIVGRDRELGALGAAVDALASGAGGVYFVVGEPGIGKSRLTEEVARLAATRGHRVVWGRCWEGPGAPALWPWIQVLRSLADGGEGLGELGRLLPESGQPGEAGADRFELFDALARFLAASAAKRPLLVALEDLHAADRASLSALGFVVRHTREAALLLVANHRDAGARPSPEALELLSRAARSAVVLKLGRLSTDEVATIAAGHDDDTVAEVYRATEGNPLFVHEVLRVLGSLGPGARRLPVPDGVRAAIREHVRLAGGIDEVLETAAALGREFQLAWLAAAAGRDPVAAADAIAPAVRAGLLGLSEPGVYRFTHVLIRDTLYEDLSPARRAELHRRTADALARLHTGDPSAPLDEIAHHFFEAGAASVDAAIDFARRAADRAIRMLAFEEAAAGLERALGELVRASPGDGRRRAELTIELARARILAGETEAGIADCLRAAELARALGSPELLARAALTYGQVYTFGRPSPELSALLEEAIGALGEREPSLRARALARLAGALQPAATPDRPIELARRSFAIARGLGDDETMLYCLQAGGSALANLVDPAERIPLDRELIRLAGARDRATALRGHVRLFVTLLDHGDVAGAAAELHAYEATAAGFRQPRYHWPAAMMRASLAKIEGRFDDDARYTAEARRLGEAAGDSNATLCLCAHDFVLARARGARHLAAPAGLMMTFTPIPGLAPLFALELSPGREAEARAAFLAAPESSLRGWTLWTAVAVRQAEVALHTGDQAIIAKVYEWLLPVAHRNGTWGGIGMTCEGPVSRWLCRLAARLGRLDEAERHYQDALARGRRMGMRPFVAALQLELGEELARHGRDAESHALRQEGRAAAEALGLHELLGGAVSAAPATVAVSEIRFAQEGDVWLIEGEGERCRVKDSRGLRMLAQLVASPGRELHALDLDGGSGAGDADGVIDTGDAGGALDPQARDEYRARAAELRQEIEQAEAWNDPGRARRAGEELEFLERELARALGLGGRERKQASAAERARINVRRRIKLAIGHVEAVAPALGRRLGECVRTGAFCCYEPDAPRRQRRR